MHCFTKLKGCKKWMPTCITLNDADENVIDLDTPLDTSVGRPSGNKKANA
jgi:hypothetical protein